jgi:hypothetical protein
VVTAQTDAPPAPGSGSAPSPGDTSAGQDRPTGLSPTDLQLIGKLQQLDAKVRAHEAAHASAAGALGGGTTLSYTVGPDGRTYAVGGEVPIEFRAGRTPQETIALAQQVLRAALAPADPSAQDLAVASQAQAIIGEAEALLSQQQSQQRAVTQPAGGATAEPARTQPSPAVPQDDPLAALALAAYRRAFPQAGATASRFA